MLKRPPVAWVLGLLVALMAQTCLLTARVSGLDGELGDATTSPRDQSRENFAGPWS